jgi:cellulose synthase/poly-beta-1,6-N-acetylglucosamine synthase-like glycosyltransferase
MVEAQRALIIVPTYNEAENLGALVRAVLAVDANFEVFIVDDNSWMVQGKSLTGWPSCALSFMSCIVQASRAWD